MAQIAIHDPNAGYGWLCKNAAYPVAIEELRQDQTLKAGTEMRQNKYLNNVIEQDHRGIKHCYYPMLGFGAFDSAKRFCTAFEEVRQYLRPRSRMTEFVSLSMRRTLLVGRVQALEVMFQSA